MPEERFVTPVNLPGEDPMEHILRPTILKEFIGQARLKDNLGLYIEAARKRHEALDHVLLSGAPGLGKTTLARIIANELGAEFHQTSGPALQRAGDLVGLLSRLNEFDILFIDEIHRLNPTLEEYLYTAMEDYMVDVVIDQGPAARSIRLTLKPFTLIGATTREGLLGPPFRGRFGIPEKLDYYPVGELKEIALRSAGILEARIEDEAAGEIAKRSRGTPRLVNRILRRVRDVATVQGTDSIDLEVARDGLKRLGIDEMGLDALDRRILGVLTADPDHPVGIKTIAAMVGEEERTIEEVYEPYLLQQGLLLKTARGRIPTPMAYLAAGKQPPDCTPGLFAPEQ
ncbi:MAG: Holliday junction branch migration DNA helicase RuvB [Planctomycetes bacterium]|nr:Holliday junction branch migration DNA helicase RuvB [Planctomycetota bacterium]